jgi:thiosulfate dehydrogenase [quinone] large subunit
MQGGEALKGFWQFVVSIPETGRPPIACDWYRTFLQALLNAQTYTWFAKVAAFGEVFVGVALILGLFTGFSALIGGFMNRNFMTAGSGSVNPVFLVISIALALAWKVPGYIGLDYFMLRPFGRRAPLVADENPGRRSRTPQPAGD